MKNLILLLAFTFPSIIYAQVSYNTTLTAYDFGFGWEGDKQTLSRKIESNQVKYGKSVLYFDDLKLELSPTANLSEVAFHIKIFKDDVELTYFTLIMNYGESIGYSWHDPDEFKHLSINITIDKK